MLLEIIWKKPTIKILYELIKAGKLTYLSANELSKKTNLSVPTVSKVLDALIALRLVEVVKQNKIKEYVRIADIHTLLPLIEEIIDISERYESYLEEKILEHINEVLGEHYYLGMFWAAFQGIDPIDYNPRIFVIYTKKPKWILALNDLKNIYVATDKKWKPTLKKKISFGVIHNDVLPFDISTETILDTKMQVTSVERGIAQCFSDRNVFYPPYAAALALVQNLETGRISERRLAEVALEEKVLPIIKAVLFYVEQRVGKKFFTNLTADVASIKTPLKRKADFSWGTDPSSAYKVDMNIVQIDEKEIDSAITTVFG